MKMLRIGLWVLVLLGSVVVLVMSQTQTSGTRNTAVQSAGEKKVFGGPFELISHTGEVVKSDGMLGDYRLIYFGYTYCPDACPIDLAKMTAALKMLDADDVDTSVIRPVFISVDPERDTPDALADYVGLFDPRLVGLTGTPEQIADIAARYSVYYRKLDVEEDGSYLMDHLVVIFFIGRDGELIRLFTQNDDAAAMAEAIKAQLVAESAR